MILLRQNKGVRPFPGVHNPGPNGEPAGARLTLLGTPTTSRRCGRSGTWIKSTYRIRLLRNASMCSHWWCEINKPTDTHKINKRVTGMPQVQNAPVPMPSSVLP